MTTAPHVIPSETREEELEQLLDGEATCSDDGCNGPAVARLLHPGCKGLQLICAKHERGSRAFIAKASELGILIDHRDCMPRVDPRDLTIHPI